jgi:hypothetical protein
MWYQFQPYPSFHPSVLPAFSDTDIIWAADIVSRCWLNNNKSQDVVDVGDRPLQCLMAVLIWFGCPGAFKESVEVGKSKGSFIRKYYQRVRKKSDFGTGKR